MPEDRSQPETGSLSPPTVDQRDQKYVTPSRNRQNSLRLGEIRELFFPPPLVPRGPSPDLPSAFHSSCRSLGDELVLDMNPLI